MRSHLFVTVVLLFAALLSGSHAAADDNSPKPRVLLLGDSISIGYTPFVQEALKGEADVFRPMLDAKRPDNCSGTTNGVKQIDKWLAAQGGKWDVIHVNFGLHDLKRVDAKGAASTNSDDPRQAEPDVYEKQLRTGASISV